MAFLTDIQWTHHSWSPWRGCEKVSPGCGHCYACELAKRNPAVLGVWGKHGTRQITAASGWRKPILWDRRARKLGERHRVFPSLCDPFEDRPDLVEPRERFAATIQATPNLDWLILTKRPGNVPRLASEAFGWDVGQYGLPPNVWLGTSVEDQEWADVRIPLLLSIPAAIRFLSVEPLLGAISLSEWLWPYGRTGDTHVHDSLTDLPGEGLGWVILGGESGARKKARRCEVGWVRSLRHQCAEAGVPVYVKQLGTRWAAEERNAWGTRRHPKGGDPGEWPEDLRVREFPEPLS